MAERLIAAVLKTAVGDEPTVGSNPSLSAKTKAPQKGAFVFYTNSQDSKFYPKESWAAIYICPH
jgi:hypothetical protein